METVEKVRGDRARIEELIARESARVRRAFRMFLDDVRSPAVRRQLRLALEQGGVEAALRVIDAHIARFGGVITEVFLAAAASEVKALERSLRRRALPQVALSFDPTHPRAVEVMRRNRLEFIRGLTRAQRESTRAALTEALTSGAGAVQTARMLRDSIGLTETQRRAVDNYRRMLEEGDRAALDRDLRDRRFDPSVRRAVEGGEPLGRARIDRMVSQYRNRYLQLRAETIARTETLRATSQAQREALDQVLEEVGLPPGRVRRVWAATQDARTRDTHAEMDGQERGVDEPFESPSGALLMYPGDSSAPPEETVNCRCVVLNEIGGPDEIGGPE